jgi:hypothetical protein
MKNILLSFVVSLAVSSSASASSDRAIGDLLDAVSAANAVFDGAKAVSGSGASPVAGGPARPKSGLAQVPAQTAAVASGAPATPDVKPTSARGITSGSLGLYSENDFELGTGRCSTCRGPLQGKWYFLDDVIATPKAGTPAIVWIGSHEMVEDAVLSDDGTKVTLKDGTVMPFSLVEKIPSNRSYFDGSSLASLKGRKLRIRGEYADIGGVRTLVGRTIWPEDSRIDEGSIKSSNAVKEDDVDALVAADKGGANAPFQTRLLWEKPGAGRDWEGKPVMGFMLNGAQGDDDEALAGHSSLFTGVYGPGGSMADWMFDNFYDMNTVSEKGIIAAMTPMDKYMADLNSGQSWYRPSYLLVMIMKDPRVPLQTQEMFKQRYAQYYAQDFKYDHTHLNCTALIADPVRAEGWHLPEHGGTPWLIAKAISAYAAHKAGDPKVGQEVFESLREEPTRSFPRASFIGAGADMLTLAGADGAADLGRSLTPYERMIQEDLVAILFVRLPQLPSSRKSGRDPAGGVIDYSRRVPSDRAQWQTVPTATRPFPPPR